MGSFLWTIRGWWGYRGVLKNCRLPYAVDTLRILGAYKLLCPKIFPENFAPEKSPSLYFKLLLDSLNGAYADLANFSGITHALALLQ